MKIILAPDSFKESLSAVAVAQAMGRGAVAACAPGVPLALVELPIADGGEGTVDCLVAATGGRKMFAAVTGPLGNRVSAAWGLLGDGRTAVLEMAAASGLPLVPRDKRNPLLTTTFGTGELIKAALDHGLERIIIGIGGSATVDGGVGLAQALGGRFRDAESREIGPGGAELERLAHVDLEKLDPRARQAEILVASDVQNPLTGPDGAARVFGPQKGATPEQVERLERGLRRLAECIRRDLGVDVERLPGGGAAGGLGAALVAFLGARLQSGIDLVLDALRFAEHLRGASLVITGEGRMDDQSLRGKAALGVARRARQAGVPCLAVVGRLVGSPEALRCEGIVAVHELVRPGVTVEWAMSRAAELVEERTCEAVRGFLGSAGP
jgi:glycerate kinase